MWAHKIGGVSNGYEQVCRMHDQGNHVVWSGEIGDALRWFINEMVVENAEGSV